MIKRSFQWQFLEPQLSESVPQSRGLYLYQAPRVPPDTYSNEIRSVGYLLLERMVLTNWWP